ncbi:SDR family NAD(P)-dependent oxidoreductase [Nonomuraea purpurea]|uniref:SDR family NAD(P)-dependent oxidoreductase n=1 Tax=Nonomuraea purpurea TaxID=1849276 RepID=A0ABV8GMR0_9ACTN
MLLKDKTAVVYGAAGAIGGAVARAFAREGAVVYLAGRTKSRLDTVADDIRAGGGLAHTTELDALHEQAIDQFVDTVVAATGRLDISFNAIGIEDVQQSLSEIALDDFLQPIMIAMCTQFLTTRAATRHMVSRGSGVILAFGGGDESTLPGLGGFKVALDAIEGHRRQWACELGRHGIRFVTLKTGGVPETIPADFPGRDAIVASLEESALLPGAATLADVGNVAAFVASDQARTITATQINISCGAMMD